MEKAELRMKSMLKLLVLAAILIITAAIFSPTACAATVYADSYGYNTTDATDALQSALDDRSANTVIVRNMGAPWVVKPIFIRRDNLNIVFQDGAVLQSQTGYGTTQSMLSCNGYKNITITGYGATFRMNKNEYTSGQWRHCLALNDVTNVQVSGLTFRDSGGDGVYIGNFVRKPGQYYCDGVTIRDCLCDNNRRNGISVVSAQNVLIDRCVLVNSNGNDPQEGIDFEPNWNYERLVNCTVSNCYIKDNYNSCIGINLTKFDSTTLPVSVSVQNSFLSTENSGASAKGIMIPYGSDGAKPGGGCAGVLNFSDCLIESYKANGLYLRNNAGIDGIVVKLKQCVFNNFNTTSKSWYYALIALEGGDLKSAQEYGNLQLQDCVFWDNATHHYFLQAAREDPNSLGCTKVSGNAWVISNTKSASFLGARAHGANVRTTVLTSPPNMTVKVSALTPTAGKSSGERGVYQFTRDTSNAAIPAAVKYRISGTSRPGFDYSFMPGFAIFAPNELTCTQHLTPVNSSAMQNVLTAVFTISPSNMYSIGRSSSSTVNIGP